jgi:hypothetical protein
MLKLITLSIALLLIPYSYAAGGEKASGEMEELLEINDEFFLYHNPVQKMHFPLPDYSASFTYKASRRVMVQTGIITVEIPSDNTPPSFLANTSIKFSF